MIQRRRLGYNFRYSLVWTGMFQAAWNRLPSPCAQKRERPKVWAMEVGPFIQSPLGD